MVEQPGSRGRKTRVAVVFGGRSAEHAISCVTAGAVLAALDRERYDVVPVGIATDGKWVLAADDPEQLAIRGGELPAVDTAGQALALPADPSIRGLVSVEPRRVPEQLGEVDVVFPLLHGPFGEDGTLQGLLELADVPYVGSGVFASAASMDKHYMKVVLTSVGLPVGPYVVIRDRDWRRERARVIDEVKRLGSPVFVKPARGGSSFGISKVGDGDNLEAAVEAAREYDPKILVEAAVPGREIECGVLEGEGDAAPDVSQPAEIVVEGGHAFYDFEAKYLDEGTRLDVPAVLPDDVAQEVRRMAGAAFDALSCEGLARVDFFYADDGRVLLNEVNTMPGFTPASMFPRVWAQSGVDYPALCERLIRVALSRRIGLR